MVPVGLRLDVDDGDRYRRDTWLPDPRVVDDECISPRRKRLLVDVAAAADIDCFREQSRSRDCNAGVIWRLGRLTRDRGHRYHAMRGGHGVALKCGDDSRSSAQPNQRSASSGATGRTVSRSRIASEGRPVRPLTSRTMRGDVIVAARERTALEAGPEQERSPIDVHGRLCVGARGPEGRHQSCLRSAPRPELQGSFRLGRASIRGSTTLVRHFWGNRSPIAPDRGLGTR